jgi:hypothetical protein
MAGKREADAMQRRESYLYVGMDLHKKTHTTVLVNCRMDERPPVS